MSKKRTTKQAKGLTSRHTDKKPYPFKITGSGRKLNQERLEREASEIHIMSYPEDYRMFMLERNGGSPEPNCFVFKGKRGELEVDWVQAFYPITASDIDTLNLRGANRVLANCAIHAGVPYDCIAISYNGSNDTILLFVKGKRRGQVWIKVWDDASNDVDLDRDTDPEQGLYYVANSFNEFLAMLCTEEEAEQRVL